MRAWSFIILVAFVVPGGLAGCRSSPPGGQSAGGSVPHLDESAANAAGLQPQEVNMATTLYVAKCARCHKFYDPSEYDKAEWHSWMKKMSRKARLQPDQQELLSRYLEAFRVAHPR